MEDEKKIETPEEKVETAVPLEKEDIYGNDEFVDAKKPEPVVEEKTEPEPEPEPEPTPAPDSGKGNTAEQLGRIEAKLDKLLGLVNPSLLEG